MLNTESSTLGIAQRFHGGWKTALPEIQIQVENCARTSAGTRIGRPVWALIGHHSVRAFDKA